MEKVYKIYKDDFSYSLNMRTSQENEEEVLILVLILEEEPDVSYKFSGTITNLIDQNKYWKKFEISEACDLIKQNYENKKIDLEIQALNANITLKTIILNNEIKLNIKLIRETEKKISNDELLETLLSKVSKLTNEISKIKVKKTEHIYDMLKNSHNWLPYPSKTIDFDTSFRYNGDVEFKFETRLNQAQNQSTWLLATLLWENVSNDEKGETIIFNQHFYKTPATESGYYNLGTVKSNKVLNFKAGEYKMKLLLEQSTNGSVLLYYYIKLHSKSRY